MKRQRITERELENFVQNLRTSERSAGTIEKYVRDVRKFAAWLEGEAVSRERAAAWRDSLLERGYAPVTVNSMVAAVNRFFAALGWEEYKVKALKIQRRLFRDSGKELSREEYERLVSAAHTQGRERLALLLETICSTGIRVSEVKYITVEAAWAGRAEISLKGKLRVILLPGKLCRKLKKYARQQKTASGEIFLTRSGKSLSRRQIWAEMKGLCQTGVGLKIEIGYVFIVGLSKLQQGIGLAHLPGPLQDQRPAEGVFFPVLEELRDFAVHRTTSLLTFCI